MTLLLLSTLALAGDGYWTTRTDAELGAALEATCEAAKAEGDGVLVEFSASWCPDCRTVRALKGEPVLAKALEGWKAIVVDPGRFDRHTALLKHWEVGAIAAWIALAPEDCAAPPTTWKVLRSGTFEPATGETRTAADLAGWLSAARPSTP